MFIDRAGNRQMPWVDGDPQRRGERGGHVVICTGWVTSYKAEYWGLLFAYRYFVLMLLVPSRCKWAMNAVWYGVKSDRLAGKSDFHSGKACRECSCYLSNGCLMCNWLEPIAWKAEVQIWATLSMVEPCDHSLVCWRVLHIQSLIQALVYFVLLYMFREVWDRKNDHVCLVFLYCFQC